VTTATTERTSSLPTVALACGIGSALEFYDFYLYGTAAAVVFNKLYFPHVAPATGTLLAFASFGIGFVARPLGGLFWAKSARSLAVRRKTPADSNGPANTSRRT
jgi:MFS family permease